MPVELLQKERGMLRFNILALREYNWLIKAFFNSRLPARTSTLPHRDRHVPKEQASASSWDNHTPSLELRSCAGWNKNTDGEDYCLSGFLPEWTVHPETILLLKPGNSPGCVQPGASTSASLKIWFPSNTSSCPELIRLLATKKSWPKAASGTCFPLSCLGFFLHLDFLLHQALALAASVPQRKNTELRL